MITKGHGAILVAFGASSPLPRRGCRAGWARVVPAPGGCRRLTADERGMPCGARPRALSALVALDPAAQAGRRVRALRRGRAAGQSRSSDQHGACPDHRAAARGGGAPVLAPWRVRALGEDRAKRHSCAWSRSRRGKPSPGSPNGRPTHRTFAQRRPPPRRWQSR